MASKARTLLRRQHGQQALSHFGSHDAGRHTVDANAFPGQLNGERLRECHNRTLARCVCGESRLPGQGGHGGEKHQAAARRANALLAETFGQADRRTHVDAHYVFNRIGVQHANGAQFVYARAVNQAVQGSRQRGDALQPAGDFIGRSQVKGFDPVAVTIQGSQRLGKTILVASNKNYARTQLTEQAGSLASNSRGGAGDHNAASGER